MDQQTIKLVQRLKDKSSKMMCNYNNKLWDTHKQVKMTKINVERGVKIVLVLK